MKQDVYDKTIRCPFGRDAVHVPMGIWYKYRTVIGNISFHFREDRESFKDSFTMQDSVFYWRDMAPIIFKQDMVEAELTRKYKV